MMSGLLLPQVKIPASLSLLQVMTSAMSGRMCLIYEHSIYVGVCGNVCWGVCCTRVWCMCVGMCGLVCSVGACGACVRCMRALHACRNVCACV